MVLLTIFPIPQLLLFFNIDHSALQCNPTRSPDDRSPQLPRPRPAVPRRPAGSGAARRRLRRPPSRRHLLRLSARRGHRGTGTSPSPPPHRGSHHHSPPRRSPSPPFKRSRRDDGCDRRVGRGSPPCYGYDDRR
jgi:hypothetical protein